MNNVSLIDGHIDEPAKLTDEQIVKALEREAEIAKDIGDVHSMMINIGIIISALDLINRKNAEIERLQKDGLQLNKTFMDFVNKAKSEARKEFAERLVEISYILNMSLTGEYVVDVSDIHNLLKEMEGE